MNTTQLRYFFELSRTLNYSTAAQQLYITQPTLSRSIMALEEEIGAKLFYRENGNVSLTPAGQLLLRELKPLSIRYDGMLQRVRNLGIGVAGELHIAVSNEQQMPTELYRAIKNFSVEYPNVDFRFSRMSTGEMRTALREEALDLAVGLEFFNYEKADLTMFSSVLLETEQPCLVRSAGGKDNVPILITKEECGKILESETLIFPAPNSMGQEPVNPIEPLREMLHLPDLSPNVRYVGDSNAVALYVSAGMGVTIVNLSHSIAKENGVELLTILGAEPYRKGIQFRTNSRNPILHRFLEFVRQS